MVGKNKIQIKFMKSRIIILTVVLLLVPILAGATPINLAVKMGAGCPFKQGPILERCNPSLIHSTSPDNLANLSLPLALLSSALPAFLSGQVDDVILAFSLDALTIFPLRC